MKAVSRLHIIIASLFFVFLTMLQVIPGYSFALMIDPSCFEQKRTAYALETLT